MEEKKSYYHSRMDLIDLVDESGTTLDEELKTYSKEGHTHLPSDIIEDSEHRFISDAEIKKLEEQAIYSNIDRVPVTIGGVESGSTFADMEIKAVLTKLLYPYTSPYSSITVTPNGGVYEVGSYADIYKVSVNVDPKTNPITKISVALGNTTLTTEDITPTTEDILKEYVYNSGNARTTTTTKVVATITEQDGKTSTVSSPEFTFVRPIYAGVTSESTTVDATLVKSLNKHIECKSSEVSKTFDCVDQRIIFAYPTSYGSLARIEDDNGFNILSAFTKTSMIINCLDGSNVSYNVYVNEASTVSNFNITFYFDK